MPLAPPTSIEDLLASPLSSFITFAANDCGYNGSFTEIFVISLHPFFLKSKSEASKAVHTNWYQAMNGHFVDEYWKVAEKVINSLETIGAGIKLSVNIT